jgi:uncharacterized repeat protein (TIGR03803 family)
MKRRTFPLVSLAVTIFAVIMIFASGVSATSPKEAVLYRFKSGTDGANPYAGLVADKAGNLYGTTVMGGTSSLGTVFEISPPGTGWTESVLYSFAGGTDGANPWASLMFDKAGNLYGTTAGGGGTGCGSGCGTVFELSPPATQGAPWTETVLYRFAGVNDGSWPWSSLILDEKGNLYGTTRYGGGATNSGTAFELSPPATQGGPWTETVLHSFGKNNDGGEPMSALVFGLHGALFGTTATGAGTAQSGIVFKLKPPATQGGSWVEDVVYRFSGGLDGQGPQASLIIDKLGNLYGTAMGGGQNSAGVVYEVSPPTTGDWTESVLYSFTAGADGASPTAALLADKSGNLYGTTMMGGIDNGGSVFELSPPATQGDPWTETTLYDFSGVHDGNEPFAGLVYGKGGQFYGTTPSGGGPEQVGAVFRLIH